MKLPCWFFLSALLFVGCGVRGKHVDFARYEAKDDTFVHLHSWTNIPLEKPADIDHLQSILERRDSTLILPFLFFSAPAIHRKGGHNYQWIDLGSAETEETKTDPVIDFDTIRIESGVVYLDERERLGYYHTQVVPGETMTKLVAAAFCALADGLAEDNLSPSGQLQKPIVTWDNFRKAMLFHVDEMAGVKDSPEPEVDEGSLPFVVSTYEMWRTAAKMRSIQVTRTRDEFVAIVPMSAGDTHQSVATYQVYQQKLAQLAKDDSELKSFTEGAESISMKAIDGPALEITIQSSKLAKAWNALAKETLDTPVKLNPVDAKYRSSVLTLQQRGIPIAPRKSIDDIVAKFFP